MSNSAILKSSIAKKYWMAATGLFLCLFLIGHLVGNLQLFKGGPEGQLAFNEYAKFMTTSPIIKIMSYLTYSSILIHVVDGIILTFQNKAARPVNYKKENANANSKWYARKMALLGSILLAFIIVHMSNFWAKMHFDRMPIQIKEVTISGNQMNGGVPTNQKLIQLENGQLLPLDTTGKRYVMKNDVEFHQKIDSVQTIKIGEGYKDLHSVVMTFFGKPAVASEFEMTPNPSGKVFAIIYALCMVVLGFHLTHGFQSAFQSLGFMAKGSNPTIKIIGTLFFGILIPVGFALIPLYIAFVM